MNIKDPVSMSHLSFLFTELVKNIEKISYYSTCGEVFLRLIDTFQKYDELKQIEYVE